MALLGVTQSSDLQMPHHLHSAAHIKEGVKRKLPVIVIVRNPKDAVLAYGAYDKNVPLKEGLLDWISFYEQVLALPRNLYGLARFEKFIRDGNEVVNDVNQIFEGLLKSFDHSVMQNNAKIRLEEISQQAFGRVHQSQPSEERNRYKEEIREQLESDALRPLLTHAQSIYEELCN
ncbi:hypothetical protein N9B13_00990 [Akkermansiaceae bacterium]|nr:hypothetical protein [Akkermansiaceae bacterium]